MFEDGCRGLSPNQEAVTSSLIPLCHVWFVPCAVDASLPCRFVEDNWESPVLGAWGLGWEVWLDGMEVTQFTYFQQVGGVGRPKPLLCTATVFPVALQW